MRHLAAQRTRSHFNCHLVVADGRPCPARVVPYLSLIDPRYPALHHHGDLTQVSVFLCFCVSVLGSLRRPDCRRDCATPPVCHFSAHCPPPRLTDDTTHDARSDAGHQRRRQTNSAPLQNPQNTSQYCFGCERDTSRQTSKARFSPGAAMGTGAAPQIPQVEARSLSDLNILAANPPQYPHHPEVRESLTLYISRVPGTRGVYQAL